MKKGKNNFFWASYSDLMTSLFFVMFVLFVIIYNSKEDTSMLNRKITQLEEQLQNLNTKNQTLSDSLKVSEEEKEKLKELEYPRQYIDNSIFKYEQKYKRFALINDVKFSGGKDTYQNSDDSNRAVSIGRSIVKLIKEVNLNTELKSLNPKYLVIIEGMASKHTGEEGENYKLSYSRAYRLYQTWRDISDIREVLDNEDICEIIIAGSGTRGVGRETMIDGWDDTPNQRFLIQIIPKISTE